MARVQVPMPQMGESIAEGTVSVWLKKVGDHVERDETIMEISTDKVDAEIPSPATGTLAEIVVKEGETVEVGTVVAYVETEGGTVEEGPAPGPAPVAESETPPAAGVDEEAAGHGVDVPEEPSAGEVGTAVSAPSPASLPDDHAPETAEERLRLRSTPLVRRIAGEHGLTLEDIPGTGRAGRVTKEDVLRYVEQGGAAAAPPRGREGVFSWDGYYTHVEHPEVEVGPKDRVEPMSRMTSLIAEHMVLSRRTAAHVHSYFEIDYSRIDLLRRKFARVWQEQGVKVTYTAFIAKAVAQALQEHPKINASISGRNVVYRGEINIGIAVALEWGLIVPVVKSADGLSLVGLARVVSDLAARARAKRLSPEEVQGGTFTITNPGVFGTVIGFPIVNQPQVAILAVGAVEKRPVVIADEFGNDAIVARKRGYLALGFDHRLVNGADADRFLARVKEILETFPDPG
ncbi:MAG: 2-oxoglutarate dehydrogenase, E2 component, dihydrolipoamide succinyltransferase [Gemmatimonas sp.]|nr:2-oxoglutarate dehydrogenase, E2 component, dihydrolipoamide succinyltransferase [Gemmatimonas sp.]